MNDFDFFTSMKRYNEKMLFMPEGDWVAKPKTKSTVVAKFIDYQKVHTLGQDTYGVCVFKNVFIATLHFDEKYTSILSRTSTL